MTRLHRAFFLLVAILVLLPLRAAQAQTDPRQVLQAVIQQLTTGTPNPSWYGAQLWQIIAMQTGNSGVYQQLVYAGQVQNIQLTGQQTLPQGNVYQLHSQHLNGSFTWLLGISNLTNRIEYMNVNPGGAGTVPPGLPGTGTTTLPPPGGGSPGGGPPGGGGAPGGGSGAGSAACQKFPELC